jgi:hypothetical protein
VLRARPDAGDRGHLAAAVQFLIKREPTTSPASA